MTISGGTVKNGIIAGNSSEGDIVGNTLTMTDGTISGDIYAGNSTGSVKDNVINIFNNPILNNSTLYGYNSTASSHSGNTLNIYTKNLTAQNIANFDNINFYLDSNIADGDTILTLTGGSQTDISGTDIQAIIQSDSELTGGNAVTLLTNSSGITEAKSYTGTATEGISLTYDLNIYRSEDGNSILASVSDKSPTFNKDTESLPVSSGITGVAIMENVMDNPTLPIETIPLTDLEDESSIEDVNVSEMANIPLVEPRGWEIFANMGGGSLRTKAGNGAYVDMTSQSINLGFAKSFEHSAGRFTIAPIIDYAHGNYDSYLADGTHGSGSTKYIAGGLIARRMLQNGFYYETSLRVGKVKTDFESSDLSENQTVTYDTSATTFSGHLRIGKNLRLNKNNLLDVYGIYYYARQGSMDAKLSSGENYNFSSADSGRARLGYRLTTRTSRISRIYTGLAYQYEHASGVTATYKNYETPSAGESGSSGMLEIGWQIKPLRHNPWMVDINTTGWVGHQRGVTAMAKIQKSF